MGRGGYNAGMAKDGVNACLDCGAVFAWGMPAERDRQNPRVCEECGERRRRAAAEAERAARRVADERARADLDLFSSIRMDDPAAEIESTEDELRRAMGESAGPDDAPALSCSAWDDEGPERLARVRRYAADIDKGRAIRFVEKETALCGPVSESPAGVAPRGGSGRDRPAAAGRRNRMRG